MKSFDQLEMLLVDDNEVHLTVLEKKLNKIGINQVVAICSLASASKYLKQNNPDIIISDYYLDMYIKEDELVKTYMAGKDIPIIFISSFFDSDSLGSYEKHPLIGYLHKNASDGELQNAIEHAIENKKKFVNVENFKLNDYIFVKQDADVVKLALATIEYISVDGKFLLLHVGDNTFIIRSSLSDFNKMLPESFLKIHQTYIINLNFMVSINLDDHVVKLNNVSLPFSRDYKKELMNAYYVA